MKIASRAHRALGKINHWGACATALALLAFSPPQAQSATLLSYPGGAQATNGPFVLGYSFTVGDDPLQAGALGVFYSGVAYALPHDVGIWDSAGTLICSATVPVGTPSDLQDNFAYVDLSTPVILNAASTYTIGVLYTEVDGNDNYAVGGDPVFNPDITLGQYLFNRNTSLSIPTQSFADALPEANVEVTVVPEPST